jgi:tRNA pseudouridine55 synthase
MAEGVLPVLLGRATRLADYIQAGKKTYRATVRLGVATDTDDAEGTVTSTADVPLLTTSLLETALEPFGGEILQTPPRYSALKVEGRRAYAVARAGGAVELQPRRVTIHELHLLAHAPQELTLEVTCSKGTYIRALARDIATALGTVGHLTALVRTSVGPFTLESSLTPDDIAQSGVPDALLASSHAIPDAPTFHADLAQASRLANGQPIAAAEILRADSVWVYDPLGHLICLACADGSVLRPRIAL